MKTIWTIFIILFALTFTVTGHSQSKDPPKKQGKMKGPERVIELDEIIVEGKIQKPEAFYILNRSEIDFQNLDLRKSFLDKVVNSVKKEPF